MKHRNNLFLFMQTRLLVKKLKRGMPLCKKLLKGGTVVKRSVPQFHNPEAADSRPGCVRRVIRLNAGSLDRTTAAREQPKRQQLLFVKTKIKRLKTILEVDQYKKFQVTL